MLYELYLSKAAFKPEKWRPVEVFGVSWAQLVLGLLPATGTGGVSGRRGAKYCHLSLTGTKTFIYPERDW